MNIEELNDAIEYLYDERWDGLIVNYLAEYKQGLVNSLCKSNEDGDLHRGEIKALDRILNLRRELLTISARKKGATK